MKSPLKKSPAVFYLKWNKIIDYIIFFIINSYGYRSLHILIKIDRLLIENTRKWFNTSVIVKLNVKNGNVFIYAIPRLFIRPKEITN